MELREIARPYLEMLSRECNKTVNLAILDKEEMVYIERIRVPSLRDFSLFVSSVGNRMPVWNTSVGRAVLTYLKPEKLREIITNIEKKPETGITEDALMRDLVEGRKYGFAINDQEYLRGIRAIAVPVFSPDGVACAINIAVEAEEISVDELKNEYAPKFIRLGRKLSRALGHRE